MSPADQPDDVLAMAARTNSAPTEPEPEPAAEPLIAIEDDAAAPVPTAVDVSSAEYGAQHTDVFQECAVPDCTGRDDRRVVFGGLSLVLCAVHRTEDGLRLALGL